MDYTSKDTFAWWWWLTGLACPESSWTLLHILRADFFFFNFSLEYQWCPSSYLVSWAFSLWWQSVSEFSCRGQARGESQPSKYLPWHYEDEALLGAETYTEPGLCATQNSGESDVSSAWSVSQSRPQTWLSEALQSLEFLRIMCKRYTTRFSETPLLKSNTVCLSN